MARRERREGDRGARPPTPAAPAAGACRGCPTLECGGAVGRQAMHGRRQATGRDAIYEETLQTRSHAFHTRGHRGQKPINPRKAETDLLIRENPAGSGSGRAGARKHPQKCLSPTCRNAGRQQWYEGGPKYARRAATELAAAAVQQLCRRQIARRSLASLTPSCPRCKRSNSRSRRYLPCTYLRCGL